MPENSVSIRAVEKLGAKLTGETRLCSEELIGKLDDLPTAKALAELKAKEYTLTLPL